MQLSAEQTQYLWLFLDYELLFTTTEEHNQFFFFLKEVRFLLIWVLKGYTKPERATWMPECCCCLVLAFVSCTECHLFAATFRGSLIPPSAAKSTWLDSFIYS